MSKESACFQINNINSKHDSKGLKKEMDAFRGVISVSVNTEKNTLAVDYDNTGVSCGRIQERLKQLGYKVEACKTESHEM